VKQLCAFILFALITLGDLYICSAEVWDDNYTPIEMQGETEHEKEGEETLKKKNVECINTQYANGAVSFKNRLLSGNRCNTSHLIIHEHFLEIPDPPPDHI
jgi:hypothetical protein